MLTNTELLLVQINNKLDQLIELLAVRKGLPAECHDLSHPYLVNSLCSAPLIKDSSSEWGAVGHDDTNVRG